MESEGKEVRAALLLSWGGVGTDKYGLCVSTRISEKRGAENHTRGISSLG